MSGTSLDGIDAVLVRIVTGEGGALQKIDYIDHASVPYSTQLKALLLPLCDVKKCRIDNLVYAHFLLGEWYAAAVQKLIEKAGFKADAIDAVCIHGQTIWHAPAWRQLPGPFGELAVHGTLQIGCAAVIKARVGIPVIYDFRAADMAVGGEGAPLAPIVDSLLFGHSSRGRVVQNIGGIGNATAIPAGYLRQGCRAVSIEGSREEGPREESAQEEGVFAFDTGPGNMIIDELVRRFTHGTQQYDEDGAIATTGKVLPRLLSFMLEDSYFALPPPKSTGREVYGRSLCRYA